MISGPVVVGDIGGTNARFAIGRPDGRGYDQERSYVCSGFPSVEATIRTYLESVNATNPEAICLAVAGPVVDDVVSFTNSEWRISTSSLKNEFATRKVSLLNDFEAVAYALPALSSRFVTQIGSVKPIDLSTEDFTVGVLGPGTGLGVSGLLCRQGSLATLVTEGGHVGFAPETQQQLQVFERLRSRYGRVSDERLVSGSGIENIYWALSNIDDVELPSAAEVFTRHAGQLDSLATTAVEMFFEILGQVAGNVALTLGAYQGIYLAGGIAQRYPEFLESHPFRAGFENKGRHRHLMEAVPTALITHPNPGLLGAAVVAPHATAIEC